MMGLIIHFCGVVTGLAFRVIVTLWVLSKNICQKKCETMMRK